jgi:hypothetical protein
VKIELDVGPELEQLLWLFLFVMVARLALAAWRWMLED